MDLAKALASTLRKQTVKNTSRKLLKSVFTKTRGLAVVDFPLRDPDRMQSFYQVAQQTDRALVINLKQAYFSNSSESRA